MEKEYFLIEKDLAQAIMNYLAEQKYRDVHLLIAELQQIKPANDERKG